jgi:hypothetical protein
MGECAGNKKPRQNAEIYIVRGTCAALGCPYLRNSIAPLHRLPLNSIFPARMRKTRLASPPASPGFHRLVYNLVYIRVYTPNGYNQRARTARARWRNTGSLTVTLRFSVAFWPHRDPLSPAREWEFGSARRTSSARNSGGVGGSVVSGPLLGLRPSCQCS